MKKYEFCVSEGEDAEELGLKGWQLKAVVWRPDNSTEEGGFLQYFFEREIPVEVDLKTKQEVLAEIPDAEELIKEIKSEMLKK